MLFDRRRLKRCFVADLLANDSSGVVATCAEVISQCGVTSVFLRLPIGLTAAQDLMGDARRIVEHCRALDVYIFVYDDPLLALRLGASGVHFSSFPGNILRVREALGVERFVGVSIESEEAARRFSLSEIVEYIDFVGVGPILQFGEKQPRSVLGVEGARRVTQVLNGKPAFWVGGIRLEDVDGFEPGFADGVGMARGLECIEVRRLFQENPLSAVRQEVG